MQLDYKDLLGLLAHKDQQAYKELQEAQDQLVHKAAKEVLDQLDQPEQLGLQDPQDRKV